MMRQILKDASLSELLFDLIGMAAIAVILAAFYILGTAVQPA